MRRVAGVGGGVPQLHGWKKPAINLLFDFPWPIPGCQQPFATDNMPPCVMNHFAGEFL